jgi:hypothetical protein
MFQSFFSLYLTLSLSFRFTHKTFFERAYLDFCDMETLSCAIIIFSYIHREYETFFFFHTRMEVWNKGLEGIVHTHTRCINNIVVLLRKDGGGTGGEQIMLKSQTLGKLEKILHIVFLFRAAYNI